MLYLLTLVNVLLTNMNKDKYNIVFMFHWNTVDSDIDPPDLSFIFIREPFRISQFTLTLVFWVRFELLR